MAELTRGLRRLLATTGAESDADLLERFVADRDGLAFAALVSRHGPMVLAVCRRVLRHRQDAEDAFQATFLVLARRAGAVKPRSLLGNWLYGVAYRTALGAKRVALARRAREAKAAAQRTEDVIPDEGLSPELRAALDRELAALPDVYRAAIVTCDLEGLSRREAVARLGWTEGTLASRLARARALLARRLSRYSLVVPAAGLTAVAGPVAVAGELAEPTIRLGVLVAAGEAVVAAPVAALMEGTMGTMLLTKFKVLAAAVVVGCAVAVTAVAGWRADAVGAADPPQPDAPKAAEAPKRVAPKSDKERIAELERERERLLKQVADLAARLDKVEAEAKRESPFGSRCRADGLGSKPKPSSRPAALKAERAACASSWDKLTDPKPPPKPPAPVTSGPAPGTLRRPFLPRLHRRQTPPLDPNPPAARALDVPLPVPLPTPPPGPGTAGLPPSPAPPRTVGRRETRSDPGHRISESPSLPVRGNGGEGGPEGVPVVAAWPATRKKKALVKAVRATARAGSPGGGRTPGFEHGGRGERCWSYVRRRRGTRKSPSCSNCSRRRSPHRARSRRPEPAARALNLLPDHMCGGAIRN